METIFSRHRNTIVLIGVLLVQVMMLAYQVRRPDSEVPLIREWVSAIVSPPQRLVAGTFRFFGYSWENYLDLRGARKEAVALQEELGRQRILNQDLRAQIGEMQRVQSLVEFRETSPSNLLVARIIGSGGNDQSRVVFLDKGREDGVRPNMGVITPDGVVGKVQRAFEGSSQVLLITDEESGVGALLENSRIHGVLRGQNSSRLKLNYVLNDEKVQVGERLFTSGEDKVFPKGLPIGTVIETAPAQDFKKIIVEPSARIDRLENVLIVIHGREVAMTPLTSASAPAAGTATASEASADPAAASASPPAVEPTSEPSTDRLGIAHGTRAETDADKIHDAFHEKTLAAQPKPPAPKPDATKPAAPPAGTKPAVTKPPATQPAATKPPATKPPLPQPPQ